MQQKSALGKVLGERYLSAQFEEQTERTDGAPLVDIAFHCAVTSLSPVATQMPPQS
jgi:hypothetical protein